MKLSSMTSNNLENAKKLDGNGPFHMLLSRHFTMVYCLYLTSEIQIYKRGRVTGTSPAVILAIETYTPIPSSDAHMGVGSRYWA